MNRPDTSPQPRQHCHRHRHRRRYIAGFTLIELMAVLAIAGIALAAALPQFGQLIRRQQLITATNALFHAIQLTRTEAIRRNRTVQLTPLDGRDWAKGWRIHLDGAKGDRGCDRESKGGRNIAQHAALPPGIRVESRSGAPATGAIAYNGGGHSLLADSWHLHLKQETRIILINFQGRARICDPALDRSHCNQK